MLCVVVCCTVVCCAVVCCAVLWCAVLWCAVVCCAVVCCAVVCCGVRSLHTQCNVLHHFLSSPFVVCERERRRGRGGGGRRRENRAEREVRCAHPRCVYAHGACMCGSQVKRSLLSDIARLCVFFGRHRVNEQLLPHLITVLNNRDWELRAAFFEHVVGVSVFVGKLAFQVRHWLL